MTPAARYGWYGDDFTGATDTLATLVQGGLKALLFLDVPTPRHLARAGALDAIGIAGATRAMAAEPMAAELDRVGRFFAAQGAQLLHYKCCSTFDSAPDIGSIGAAIKTLKPYFPCGLTIVVGGQPDLGRYCLFGNLFAAAGAETVFRIDRHPTMSVHPVTPMLEADLRRHLLLQGVKSISSVDFRAYSDEAAADKAYAFAKDSEAILYDVSSSSDLAAVGRLISRQWQDGPVLAVGASSVAQAYLDAVRPLSAHAPSTDADTACSSPVLALVGSLSPVTRAQVAEAHLYTKINIDPTRLTREPHYREALARQSLVRLADGNVMLVTETSVGIAAAEVATATAGLLGDIVRHARLSRLLIAGGDTSSQAIKALDIWGLSYRGRGAVGAPLVVALSDTPALDGLELILKGGQMGSAYFFDQFARHG